MRAYDVDWVSRDTTTGWDIYGYGHALAAVGSSSGLYAAQPVHLLLELDLDGQPVNETMEAAGFPITGGTRVPALLELTMALTSVQERFDPFDTIRERSREDRDREATVVEQTQIAELERAQLGELARELALRQAAVDELERYLLQEAHAARSVFSSLVSQQIAATLLASWERMLRAAASYALIATVLLLGASGVVVRIVEGKFGASDFISTIGMVFSAVAVIALLISWKRHTLGRPS
jgi:hypothetical protein